MKFGPLSLRRRRTLRRIAGFVVGFLLGAQAMAATGYCSVGALKAPQTERVAQTVCSEHGGGSAPAADVKHNCPSEEPTSQARSADLPTVGGAAAIVDATLYSVGPPALTTKFAERPEVPPPPLYSRLQRLRL